MFYRIRRAQIQIQEDGLRLSQHEHDRSSQLKNVMMICVAAAVRVEKPADIVQKAVVEVKVKAEAGIELEAVSGTPLVSGRNREKGAIESMIDMRMWKSPRNAMNQDKVNRMIEIKTRID